MKNTDWKSIGIMAGISLGVFVIGTILTKKVIDPAMEKAKAKKLAESSETKKQFHGGAT